MAAQSITLFRYVNSKDYKKPGLDKIIRETKTIDNTKKTDDTKTNPGAKANAADKKDNNMLMMMLALMAMIRLRHCC